jgi:hypothetical protein
VLYLALGSPVGYAPLVYFAVIVGSIVVFSRNRDFNQLLRTGQIAILLAPTLSMIPLGGFLSIRDERTDSPEARAYTQPPARPAPGS